jgi:four helix bundle protein
MTMTGERQGNQDDARATMSDSGFRNLYVWKEGKSLAVHIFLLTQTGLFAEDRSFRDQIRRSAVRIPANIAEGDERGRQRDTLRSLYAAKAALAKLWTQLEIAREIHYLSEEERDELSERCRKLERMLSGLIQSRTAVQ